MGFFSVFFCECILLSHYSCTLAFHVQSRGMHDSNWNKPQVQAECRHGCFERLTSLNMVGIWAGHHSGSCIYEWINTLNKECSACFDSGGIWLPVCILRLSGGGGRYEIFPRMLNPKNKMLFLWITACIIKGGEMREGRSLRWIKSEKAGIHLKIIKTTDINRGKLVG